MEPVSLGPEFRRRFPSDPVLSRNLPRLQCAGRSPYIHESYRVHQKTGGLRLRRPPVEAAAHEKLGADRFRRVTASHRHCTCENRSRMNHIRIGHSAEPPSDAVLFLWVLLFPPVLIKHTFILLRERPGSGVKNTLHLSTASLKPWKTPTVHDNIPQPDSS